MKDTEKSAKSTTASGETFVRTVQAAGPVVYRRNLEAPRT